MLLHDKCWKATVRLNTYLITKNPNLDIYWLTACCQDNALQHVEQRKRHEKSGHVWRHHDPVVWRHLAVRQISCVVGKSGWGRLRLKLGKRKKTSDSMFTKLWCLFESSWCAINKHTYRHTGKFFHFIIILAGVYRWENGNGIEVNNFTQLYIFQKVSGNLILW